MPKKNKGRGRGRGRGQGQGQGQPVVPGDEDEGAVGGPRVQQQQPQQWRQPQQQQGRGRGATGHGAVGADDPQQQQQQQQQQQWRQPQQQQQQRRQPQQQQQQQWRQPQQQQQRQPQQQQQQPQQQQQQQWRQPQQQQHQQQQFQPEQSLRQHEEEEVQFQLEQPRHEPKQESDEKEEPRQGPRGEEEKQKGATSLPTQQMVEEFKQKVVIDNSKTRLPPNRPGEGNVGRMIRLVVNHIDLRLRPQQEYIFMNDVDVSIVRNSPERPSGPPPKAVKGGKPKGDLPKEKLRAVVNNYLFKQMPEFQDVVPAYDGNKNIYTNRQLRFPAGGKSFTFRVDFDGRGDPVEVKVTVKEVQQIDLAILQNYVSDKFRGRDGSSLNMPQDPMRGLTAVFRAALEAADFMSMGNSIISQNRMASMQCGPYDIHDGMFISVRPQMWTIRLNVDKTQIVLRQSMPLVDFVINERLSANRRMNQQQAHQEPITGFELKAIEKKLRGVRVQADHFMNGSKRYSRKFTVQSLSRESARDYTIPDLKCSVAKYMMDNYRINLQYPHWPCVCVNRDKRTMIPMEMFHLLPFQRAPNDNPDITREIIRHAAIKPFDRRKRIEGMVNHLRTDRRMQTILSEYGIQINPQLHEVSGRVLPAPMIEYNGSQVKINQPGSWRADRARFCTSVVIEDIYVANFSRNDPSRGIETLLRSGNNVGMRMPQFNSQMIQNGLRWDEHTMRQVFNECKNYWKDKLDRCMLIVVLPPFDDSAYGTVKRLGDNEYGILTQCLKDRTLGKMNPQTAGNILLKMNAKMNGVNWKVHGVSQNPAFAPLNVPFIVFGADVTHPSPTGNRQLTRSIAAVVASVDKSATTYKSAVSFQESTRGEGSVAVVELIQDLQGMVKNLLITHYRSCGQKPHSIIFFRDGVSEGQFKDVIDREVAAIQEACVALDKDYHPGITFIVVQKRHHTRFFPADRKDEMRSGNVPAGTIVDKDIVHPREFDFFLCSHDGIQGTSKPCHYHVLWDDNGWTANDLQCFTYYLCHSYARCTRSVSYPAPTYYAHLVAFRAREVHGNFESSDSGSSVSGATARSGDGHARSPADETPKLKTQYFL